MANKTHPMTPVPDKTPVDAILRVYMLQTHLAALNLACFFCKGDVAEDVRSMAEEPGLDEETADLGRGLVARVAALLDDAKAVCRDLSEFLR
jgi:hypothetical protein